MGRVDAILALVGLGELRDRYPRQLSGGQQQRVAFARSLVLQPSVLLLDEPLSNLDAKLREEMRVELRELQQRLKITTVFVTHDQEEALAISDRVIVMRAGCVEQDGSPRDLFNRPRTEFVARFMGSPNVMEGTWLPSGALQTASGLVIRADPTRAGPAGTRGVVAVRPQNVRLSRVRADKLLVTQSNIHAGTIEFMSYRGSFLACGVHLETGERLQAHVACEDDDPGLAPGDPVVAHWEARHTIVPTIQDGERRSPC